MLISNQTYSMDGAMAQAFNGGSDARYAGVPYDECPVDDLRRQARTLRMDERYLVGNWQRGWLHLSDYWGLDVPPFRQHAKVQGWVPRRIPDLDDGVPVEGCDCEAVR